MIFKAQKLEDSVILIRGYRNNNDIKFCFVCTLYRSVNEKEWQILGALSRGCTIKETKEVFEFLKNFPDGTYAYVSNEDFERFYKRYRFKCIDFKK